MNKKKIIIALVSTLIVLSSVVGGIFVYQEQARQNAKLDVMPVEYLITGMWGGTMSSNGTVTSDFSQEIYPESDKIVTEILVEEGAKVKAGDVLIKYDTTRLEIDAQKAALEIEKTNLALSDDRSLLNHLLNATPYVEPVMPTPEPTPMPQAVLNTVLDENAVPYTGDGSSENPYRFVCTMDARMTESFLKKMLGQLPKTTPTPTPVPTIPSAVPSASPQPSASPTPNASSVPTNSSTPTNSSVPTTSSTPSASPTPSPVPIEYYDAFSAVFEVREGDNENAPLIYAWSFIDNAFEMGFDTYDRYTPPEIEPEPEPEPVPTDPYYYYSREELDTEIKRVRQEISDLELQLKQQQLASQKADLALDSATVTAIIDGTVTKLISTEEASLDGSAFMIVSGGEGFYFRATLSESLLGTVNEGDMASIMTWEGMSYNAQIVEISIFPESAENFYYGTSPNNSHYGLTAYIEDASGLENGMGADIFFDGQTSFDDGAMYLDRAYIREDTDGSYVLKADENNKIAKAYIITGKAIYNNSYVEILDGLLRTDKIGFPYGPDAVVGATATENEGGMYW